MRGIQAVLFDVDGTLLDTREFVFQAFEHALHSRELPCPKRRVLASMIGKTLAECYSYFAPRENHQELIDSHRAFQVANLHLATAFPGARATLRQLKDSGLKTAAITSRSKLTSVRTLELAGLDSHIDVLISWEDVVRPKPHPEPLLKALGALDVCRENAVMVGDTDTDMEAGRSAGVRTIGLTCGFHGSDIARSDPDLILDNVDQILVWVLPDQKDMRDQPNAEEGDWGLDQF